MATKSDFELPLRDYINIAEDGYASFSYPYEVGVFLFVMQDLDSRARRALEAPKGRGRDAAFREVAEQIAKEHAKHELIHRQWDAYIDARRAEQARAETP